VLLSSVTIPGNASAHLEENWYLNVSECSMTEAP